MQVCTIFFLLFEKLKIYGLLTAIYFINKKFRSIFELDKFEIVLNLEKKTDSWDNKKKSKIIKLIST